MDASVFAEIDVFGRHLNGCHQGLDNAGSLTSQGDDDSIVVGVGVDVEDMRVGRRTGNLRDDFRASSL